MKNLRFSVNSVICLALVVPAGVVSGNVRVLGAGLTVAAQTDRATAATIASGVAAPGLKDGEASCRLVGVTMVLDLALANAVGQYDKVYVAPDGTYSATATGNKFVGYALDALAAPGTTRVALSVA